MLKTPEIAIIVAMDLNRGIGLNGDMPWRLSADLKRFKAITMGYPVIMGRRTFESLPKGALPGRTNIVVSSNPFFKAENAIVVGSPAAALAACCDAAKVFVIGGGQLYRYFVGVANTLHITKIHHAYPADTHFPEIPDADFSLTLRESITNDPAFPYPYDFLTYQRKLIQHE